MLCFPATFLSTLPAAGALFDPKTWKCEGVTQISAVKMMLIKTAIISATGRSHDQFLFLFFIPQVISFVFFIWQGNIKCRSLAFDTVDPDLAMMHLDYFLGDRKSKSRSALSS